MRIPRHRLLARITLAILLATLGLPATGGTAHAASDGLSLTVRVGYDDVVKGGEWMPVVVDAKNAGPGIDGTLEIQAELGGQPGITGFTIYQQPISLATGASKRIRTYVIVESTGITLHARVVANGRVLVSQLPGRGAGSSTSALIGVLSDQTTSLDDFAAIHPAGVAARVVHLRSDEIADSAVPLRAFDMLAIDDFATDSLTTAQRRAIADYVETGGTLLLGTGPAWRKTLAGLPSAILPMQPKATQSIHAAQALGGSMVEVASADSANGRAWLSEGSVPLILDRAVGAGTVTMATFDWNQDQVANWSGTRALLRQAMTRAFFRPHDIPQNFAYGIGGPGGLGVGSHASLASKSGALLPVLSNVPGLDLPSLQLTGGLVLLYVLLVGPVNYFVLGAMRRRALAWITVPLIAIIAAGGAYGAGVFTKGRSVQANQVAIVHLQPGWERAYQENYTGIMAPTRGDYQASIAGDRVLIGSIGGYGKGIPGSGPGGVRVSVESNGVTLPGMTAFVLGGFATESISSAPQLSGHLELDNGQLQWKIENHSSLSFTDAVVIAGDSYEIIGTLKPGASAAVSLEPKAPTPTFGGQPVFSRIYGNPYGGNVSSSRERERFAKSQILSLLPTGVNFKGLALSATPLLVAWTNQRFQDVTVNGSRPRSTSESAVALSLPVDQIGTGPLPAGIVEGRIVDVVGDSQGQGPPGMLTMQNGTVTYDFAPPIAAGTRLTGASLNASNPFGPRFAGPAVNPAQPVIHGQVWDWSHAGWTDIAYQDNGTTALPDGAVNPNGLIRLRLNTTNGAYMPTVITISGTVQ